MGKPLEPISLGCRLNAYEADRMASLAARQSDVPTLVVNTCAVTNEAVRQSRQTLRRARRDHPDARIVASGCAVQLDPEGFRAMDAVDGVIGNADKLNPAAWQNIDTSVGDVFEPETLPEVTVSAPAPEVRSHLEVQNGCDHRCTFCIIPFGRGRARSKPVDAICREAAKLADQGVREIILTGVDLTSYGPDLGAGISIADPIEALLGALPNDVRLRLSSIDGAEVDDALFQLVTKEDRIAPHIHLSLQSGDTMILKRMKRRHSREEAVDLCQRLKAARPEIALGADLIAGFPTENEEMFVNSLRLVDDCALSYVHVFPFSPRTGTPAARMPQLPREEIKKRAARLRAAAETALARHLDQHLGQERTMLIEQHKGGAAVGKLPDFSAIRVHTDAKAGEHLRVFIDGHDNQTLSGHTI